YQWQLTVVHGEHNHKPSHNPAAHPILRRLTDSQRGMTHALLQANVQPRQAVTALRQHVDPCYAIQKTIYNEQQALRTQALDGRTPLQSLLQQL
ncbi:uncharacterized protein EV422DRAFT_481114, partial [Fimicolochytrium jonesii]|uniref:uncharacterized protein n=1 Tax=Fimicolochytrium jonesii TaxID=1396493 RepID=UPI0022FF0E0F